MPLLCAALDVDVSGLIELANRHPRVSIPSPGPGVDGHRIAVDPRFIVHSAPQIARLIRTAREINGDEPNRVVARVLTRAGRFHEPCTGCFGLAFKADIDDRRESPALIIVEALARAGAGRLLVVEPHVNALPERPARFDPVRLVDTRTALEEADVVPGLVDHGAFRELDPRGLGERIVIDTPGEGTTRVPRREVRASRSTRSSSREDRGGHGVGSSSPCVSVGEPAPGGGGVDLEAQRGGAPGAAPEGSVDRALAKRGVATTRRIGDGGGTRGGMLGL